MASRMHGIGQSNLVEVALRLLKSCRGFAFGYFRNEYTNKNKIYRNSNSISNEEVKKDWCGTNFRCCGVAGVAEGSPM